MSLTLHFHPLACYCHKVLIALYENGTPFTPSGRSVQSPDCAAAPALFYANEVLPFGDTNRNVAAYFDRLKARPSYARVLREAEPNFEMFLRQAGS